MQIFVTDPDPIKCARYLDNRRVNKMCVETAQLLSNAMWIHGSQGPYKLTHKNTKISKWVSWNHSNYLWSLEHFKALLQEYSRRFNKKHKTESLVSVFETFYMSGLLPVGYIQPFVNNAKRKDLNLDFTNLDDVFEAYKQYLDARWQLEKKNNV